MAKGVEESGSDVFYMLEEESYAGGSAKKRRTGGDLHDAHVSRGRGSELGADAAGQVGAGAAEDGVSIVEDEEESERGGRARGRRREARGRVSGSLASPAGGMTVLTDSESSSDHNEVRRKGRGRGGEKERSKGTPNVGTSRSRGRLALKKGEGERESDREGAEAREGEGEQARRGRRRGEGEIERERREEREGGAERGRRGEREGERGESTLLGARYQSEGNEKQRRNKQNTKQKRGEGKDKSFDAFFWSKSPSHASGEKRRKEVDGNERSEQRGGRDSANSASKNARRTRKNEERGGVLGLTGDGSSEAREVRDFPASASASAPFPSPPHSPSPSPFFRDSSLSASTSVDMRTTPGRMPQLDDATPKRTGRRREMSEGRRALLQEGMLEDEYVSSGRGEVESERERAVEKRKNLRRQHAARTASDVFGYTYDGEEGELEGMGESDGCESGPSHKKRGKARRGRQQKANKSKQKGGKSPRSSSIQHTEEGGPGGTVEDPITID
uniref:Uncharacterized protein n=1 Tax=Palpitomonas bilix TaxID=652834 RepID=A0A7S3D1T0_9EUKA|mmetsp:Transcript_18691/g.47259  ORF Transcript_18691/g.47259 Transcript_18691/m.47259 type:complete len:504 (+) Transcript_18691:416-1927(+)